MLTFGVDRAAEFAGLFTGRTALVTGASGLDSRGRSTVQVLQALCDLRLLLAPEHGIRGDRAAGECFGSTTDPETGLEVMSLYTPQSRRLPWEAFDKLDCIVYDIQDVGCRYYTYISTLKSLVEDCARYGKRLVVLDRPNPLGDRVMGKILEPELMSFVGCYDIPVCYAMTCGEFARMINGESGSRCDLHVVPCGGLTRDMTFPDWGKPWVKPSPNIPDYETALLYPGTCLFEGTQVSEGRGTDVPFATVGAPFVDGDRLSDVFNSLALPGVQSEGAVFTPVSSKHAGQRCGGIRLEVTDPTRVNGVDVGIHLLALIRQLYPEHFRLLPPTREDPVPFISRLAGHRLFEGDWHPEDIRDDSQAFIHRKEIYHLYGKRVESC